MSSETREPLRHTVGTGRAEGREPLAWGRWEAALGKKQGERVLEDEPGQEPGPAAAGCCCKARSVDYTCGGLRWFLAWEGARLAPGEVGPGAAPSHLT